MQTGFNIVRHSPLSVALLAVMMAAGSTAGADEAVLQRQLDAQQRVMIEQQNQIDNLQTEVAALRGEIEKIKHQLNGMQQEAAAPAPVAAAPAPAPAPAAPAPAPAAKAPATPPAPPLPAATDDAKAAYDAAYAKVTNGDFDGARAAFSAYLDQYPESRLTPNAWYWLGQVQYRQKSFEDARVSFLNVARYNDSNKRPDALYKLGLISRALGDNDKAGRYFNLVISTYPGDTAATMAQKELSRG